MTTTTTTDYSSEAAVLRRVEREARRRAEMTTPALAFVLKEELRDAEIPLDVAAEAAGLPPRALAHRLSGHGALNVNELAILSQLVGWTPSHVVSMAERVMDAFDYPENAR